MTATHAIQPIIIIKESAYIVKDFIWKYEQKPLVITELRRNTNLFQAQTENHIIFEGILTSIREGLKQVPKGFIRLLEIYFNEKWSLGIGK